MKLPRVPSPPLALLRKRRSSPPGSLLGLAFEGGTLRAVELRRTNGAAEIRHQLAVPLSLDLLTDEPELVGREIRKHLDAHGIRERGCVACLPQEWAHVVVTPLPELSDADLESYLEIEAERGFASAADSLVLGRSLSRLPLGGRRALLVGIPRHHVARLGAVLAAAQLRPASFSLGLPALQPAGDPEAPGVLALRPCGERIHIQASCFGGIATLRTISGAFTTEGGTPELQTDLLSRELRITLGQLPSETAEAIRHLRVFGDDEAAVELVEALRPVWEPQGLAVEAVRLHPPGQLPLQLPPGTAISPALALATRFLADQRSPLEFLPPTPSRWQQLTERYASRKLVPIGVAVGAVAALVALTFGVQQTQLWYWGSKWEAMKAEALELEGIQRQIRQYRPWYDESLRSLSILRRVTEAFPEDGSVSAKTVEIRERAGITCTGTARDNTALLRTLDKLRAAPEVQAIKVDQIRGRSPLQFTFRFQWADSGTP